MGDHDQTVLQRDDAHQNIHDDGRTLRPVREDEFVGVYDDFGHRDLERPHDARAAFVFRGGKLIPDTVYIHPDPFLVTDWESQYSDVFALESPKFHYEASFAPVVDDGWRVVGHVGWADGCDICVPGDTVQKGSKFWYILQQRRLGQWRQELLDEADEFDRGPYPNPFHAVTPSSPPVRKPVPCVPPAPTIKLKPTMWEEARRGPLEDKSIEDTYQNNLNYFVKGGGKALVGFSRYLIERNNKREDSWYARYLDLKIPASSGYRFQVLVSPDGYLQAVLGIEKVRPKTRGDKIISDTLEGIDIALTVLMIIDIFTIPVALFRLGALVAEKAAIQAVEVVVTREAEAAVDLATQEAKRELLEAGSAAEAADAKAGLRGVSSKLKPATEEEFGAGAGRRVSAIDRGRGARPFYGTSRNRLAAASPNMNIARETAGTGGIRAVSGVRAADGSKKIVVEGSVRKSIARRGFEKNLVSGSDLGLPTYERLHLWGPRLGDEAAAGIWLGPGKINIGEQARVEKLLQDLATKAEGTGGTVRLSVTGATYPPGDLPINLRAHEFLSEITYEFRLEGPGIKPLSGRITISIGPPPHGSVQTLGADVLDAMLKAH